MRLWKGSIKSEFQNIVTVWTYRSEEQGILEHRAVY